MVQRKKTTTSESQTHDKLSEVTTQEIARIAWEQATRDDQKLDEIKRLIESGEHDRAIDLMSEFVGAKKPAGSENYGRTENISRAG